jgi:hypothetical protein
MKHSSFHSSLCGIAGTVVCLGALVISPGSAAAKRKQPPATPTAADAEARSKELMKKHFPLEEDIGPLPVVRVPKVEEPPKAPPPSRFDRRRGKMMKASAEPKPAPPPVAPPAAEPPAVEKPVENPVAAAPPKKEPPPPPPPREVHAPASEITSEASRKIDDLLSNALTDTVPQPEVEEEVPAGASLPPLGMAAIKETMATVQPEVKKSCRLGRLGVVQVRVIVTPSGEVARVTPEGKLAQTPPASCVAERVRRARFPRSGGGNFQYTLTVR